MWKQTTLVLSNIRTGQSPRGTDLISCPCTFSFTLFITDNTNFVHYVKDERINIIIIIIIIIILLLEQIKFEKHNNIKSSLYLQPIMKYTVQSEVFT